MRRTCPACGMYMPFGADADYCRECRGEPFPIRPAKAHSSPASEFSLPGRPTAAQEQVQRDLALAALVEAVELAFPIVLKAFSGHEERTALDKMREALQMTRALNASEAALSQEGK